MAHSPQNPAWSHGLSATVAAESKHKMHGLTITLWLRISSSFSGLQHIKWVHNVNCNRKTNIHAVRTSGEKFISSLHCVAKKEKSKRVPELGGRELTDLSPDVLTA